MFLQLWDLVPNFMEEWVDSRALAPIAEAVLGPHALTAASHIKPELLIDIDAFTIILFVLPVSFLAGKIPLLLSLILGMSISLLGFIGLGATQNGAYVVLFIFVFAIGEMIASPKFSEYVARIAPSGKHALYMGLCNLPFAIGWSLGNLLGGPLYSRWASRLFLARRYLTEHLAMPADWQNPDKLPNDVVLDVLQARLQGASPDTVSSSLEHLQQAFDSAGQTFTDVNVQKALFELRQLGNGISLEETTEVLWQTYQPWVIWLWIGLLGAASIMATGILAAHTHGKNKS